MVDEQSLPQSVAQPASKPAALGRRAAVTLSGVLGISLHDLSHFQKPDRKHVRQGMAGAAARCEAAHPLGRVGTLAGAYCCKI